MDHVHLAHPMYRGKAACSHAPLPAVVTRESARVTCGQCQRTVAFRAAVARREDVLARVRTALTEREDRHDH